MEKKTCAGLFLGAGHFAKIQLEAWQNVTGVQLVGICNRSVGKAEDLAKQFKIAQVGNCLEDMLDKLHPDFVDICTAVPSHWPYVKLSVEHGVPVLCQKPIAPTWDESIQLVEYCTAKKVRLMVNDNWRWQSWYREVKNLVEQGVIGDVFYAYCAMRPGDGWGPEPYKQQPYFRDCPQFLLMETGIHYMDTFRYLFGDIVAVYCRTRRLNSVIAGEDFAVVVCEFENGMTAVYDANRLAYTEHIRSPMNGFMFIEGSRGNIRLESGGNIFITLRGHSENEHIYTVKSGYRGGKQVKSSKPMAVII